MQIAGTIFDTCSNTKEKIMFREIGEERTFNGILKQIIENIQKGTLKAGAALPAERVMAEAMGVSRSAVREVLRALELLGIVESVPGGGNYITSDLDTAELLIILTRLDGSEDEKTRGDLDKELHHKIAKIADNPMLYSVLSAADQLIESSIFGTRDYIMLKNQSVKDVDDQHRRLVHAIINGDAKEAEHCMSEHMQTIEKYMLEMQKER